MSTLYSYKAARLELDNALEEIRKVIEQAVNTAKNQAAAELLPVISNGVARDVAAWGFVSAYRERLHRDALIAFLSARAALVGLVRPQGSKTGSTQSVASRNRRAKGTGKRKPFPSDSHKRGVVQRTQGHRARYRLRWLGTFTKEFGKARGLPILALLESKRVGRPEVPRIWRNYRRRIARAKQLQKQRLATAARRKEKGWKPYPRNRKQDGPREGGWSNPVQWRSAPAVYGIAVAKVRAANIDFLRRESAKKRKAWEAAH